MHLFYFISYIISILLVSIIASPRLERITTKYLSPQQQQQQQQRRDQAYNPATPTNNIYTSASLQPLAERSLDDWDLNNIILLSDINGSLHCVNRDDGNLIWSLPIDEPLVKIQSNIRTNQQHIIFFGLLNHIRMVPYIISLLNLV